MASISAKPLQNIYYERKVATEKPCYICKRPTVVVLATIDTKDFLYTCDSHLTDSATLISPPPAPSGPSQEEIKKVIADYKAREEKKGVKSDDKDKDKKEDKEKEIPKPASPIPSTPAPPSASHRKFALHRQIFEMRRDDIKRKEQGVKAREVGKGLPQVPRGMF